LIYTEETAQKPRKTAAKVEYSEQFERFWGYYPQRNGIKRGKATSYTIWRTRHLERHADGIIARLEIQKRHKRKCDRNKEFCAEFPDPERWLRNSRWNDEVRG